MTWHAVDAGGRDPATGRLPTPPGWSTPSAALGAIPVATWPVAVIAEDGQRLTFAGALGPNGDRVQELLDALAGAPAGNGGVEVLPLARTTPAGTVGLPLAVLALQAGAEAARRVDPAWLGGVDARRAASRQDLVDQGRGAEMEAALHVAILLGTERLDPADDAYVDAHVASGARLWLLTGAVVSALAGAEPDPFEAWARLVTAGWWPVGPSGGRLVVSRA